jgi:8-oxo-dGTP pyrophosphatase MutT (NUDIX family)
MPDVVARRPHSGTGSAAVPRDATTVVLLREGVDGLEVFMMRRPETMRFAPGVHVFPGGAVEDQDDAVPLVPNADVDRLGARAGSTRPAALVAAAVRETFEECGVLLAVDREGAPPHADESLTRDRIDLYEGRCSFESVLRRRGLVLDPALLPLMAHWVTPAQEPRRFDTRFFTAVLPEGQQVADLGKESAGSAWQVPARALSAYAQGQFEMWPPTVATLQWLAGHDGVGQALVAARGAVVLPVMPRPVGPDGDDGQWELADYRTGRTLDPQETTVTGAAARAGTPGPAGPVAPDRLP